MVALGRSPLTGAVLLGDTGVKWGGPRGGGGGSWGEGKARPPRGRHRGGAGKRHVELRPGRPGASGSLGEMLRWEPPGLEPVGGILPKTGVRDRPSCHQCPVPRGDCLRPWGPGPPLGLKREMKAAMPRGWGAPGLTLRSSGARTQGGLPWGLRRQQGDPGPALEDPLLPPAEVLTDHPPGCAARP